MKTLIFSLVLYLNDFVVNFTKYKKINLNRLSEKEYGFRLFLQQRIL